MEPLVASVAARARAAFLQKLVLQGEKADAPMLRLAHDVGEISIHTHLSTTERLRHSQGSGRLYCANGDTANPNHRSMTLLFTIAICLAHSLRTAVGRAQLSQISRRNQCYPAGTSEPGNQHYFGCASNDTVLVTHGCGGWLFCMRHAARTNDPPGRVIR